MIKYVFNPLSGSFDAVNVDSLSLSGTVNYVPKFTSANTIGDSSIIDSPNFNPNSVVINKDLFIDGDFTFGDVNTLVGTIYGPNGALIVYDFAGDLERMGSSVRTTLQTYPLVTSIGPAIDIMNLIDDGSGGRVGILTGTPNFTLDVNGEIGTKSLYFDETYYNTNTTPSAVGSMYWDDGEGCPVVILKGGVVALQLGQELLARVYNGTGSQLTDGQVVYITGSQGNRISVQLASNSQESTSAVTFGVVTEPIQPGQEGFVTISGTVRHLNTTGFTAGQPIWLGSTPGSYTATKPVAPAHAVLVGYIERVHASVGSIFVKIQNYPELDELHDVLITSPSTGQLLRRDSDNLWKNWTPNYATESYVTTSISNLVASAPATLDTLNELATALGNDPNFATTISTALGNRLRVDISTQGLNSTQQANGRTNLGATTVGSNFFTLANPSAVTFPRINADNTVSALDAAAFRTAIGAGTGTLTAETDTLATVTGRGATTTLAITAGGLTLSPAADTSALTSSTYSVTGSGTTSMVNLSGTVNTTGNVTPFIFDVTNTASGSGSFLVQIRRNGSYLFGIGLNDTLIYANSYVSITGSWSVLARENAINGINFGSTTNSTHTSGNRNHIRLNETFAPTSGTGTYSFLNLNSTVNQTGGANGITRGVHINPNLTAAADWRSLEWSNNTGWGLYGAGTALNHLSGNLLIGTTSDASYKLLVNSSGSTYVSQFRGSSSSYIVVGDSALSGESGLNARNSFGQLFLGIGTSGEAYFSGTNGATSLRFSLGGTTRLTVNSSGNIGIGTSSPSFRVDVQGTSLADSTVAAQGSFNVNQLSAPGAIGGFTLSSGTNLGVGTYVYFATFVTALGETSAGSTLTVTTTAGNTTVNLTSIPTSSDPRVTARKLYRTKLNGSSDNQWFLTTINDNVTTTYTDSIADASLTGLGLQAYKVNTTSRHITVGGVQSIFIDPNLTAIGRNAGSAIITSSSPAVRTVLVGAGAGQSITTGAGNVIVGVAGINVTTGSSNTLIGDLAGFVINTASNNTVVGAQAGRFLTTGNNNTIFGANTGRYLADGSTLFNNGSNNVLLGSDIRMSTANDANSIVIGFDARGLGSNTTVIGNTSTTFTSFPGGNVGIGTTTDNGSRLNVSGTTRLGGNTTIVGSVEDASGSAALNISTANTSLRLGGNTTYSWIQSHSSKPVYINELGNNVILNLSGGSVGIGKNNPGTKLDVNGVITATGGTSTDWNTAFAERNNWDGGSTNLVAATGRSSLGATTVGSNLFTLVNPSAVTFLRINADNSVSALDAASFRTAIGVGTGTGTVISVAMTVPTGLTVSGSPITSSGTLTVSLQSGYSIPTTAAQANWTAAYGWGDHSTAGYLSTGGGTISGGNLYMNANYLEFSGTSGFPLFNSSSGNQIVLQAFPGANQVDMAIGSSTDTVWSSVPEYLDAYFFKWYGGETAIMSLTGTGDLTVKTVTETSSLRYKENIVDLEPVSEKVEALRPVAYNRIGQEEAEIGLIAEEVAEIFPEVVSYDEQNRPDGINYSRLSAILIKAVQELSAEIKKLKN